MSDTGQAMRGGRQRVRVCRGLLWALLFAALQGLLGPLLVSTLAQGPVTEVCTPQGMQWVATEMAPEAEDAPVRRQVLASTCVWSMAHVAAPVDPPRRLLPHRVAMPQVLPGRHGLETTHSSDRPGRVLLMAPMRAPPLWQS